jgi:hypothetical protein
MSHTLPILTIFLIGAIFPSILFSAPLITSKTGNFTEGSNFEISGSGFGTHPLTIEWLGGSSGNIESGAVGGQFSKTNWTNIDNSAIYSTNRAHSGTKSIESYYTTSATIGSDLRYDYGSTISKIYVTWWTYFHYDACGGQWKTWRLRPNSSVSDTDGEIYQSTWYNQDGTHMQQLLLYFCDVDNYAQCYPDSSAALRWMTDDDVVAPGSWHRLELYAEASSDAGVRDGTVIYNIHHQNVAVRNIRNHVGTVITRATGVTATWRYWHFMNYWGNHTHVDGCVDPDDAIKTKIYIDDPYIQVGTQARVELCDATTWPNREHCEIQNPTAWSLNSITVTVNQGSFVVGSNAYLYVVDADGNVSNQGQGYPVTLGTPNQEPTGPARVKGVHVLN